ncbi:MAG: putative adenine-specific DNA-methyltransferase [Herbinix sp.]|jgi:DNA modification methylase|nr:putative adenine-specific DNA-methyltransferase [Herbinix sp.]
MNLNHIYHGDALEILKTLPDNSVDCGVTSPPYYGLRDYGVDGQIGLEESPEEYINRLVSVFREFRRVLKPEGTLWVNIGDSYVGTGGDRKNPVSNKIFNQQQQSNPKDGRYQRTQTLKEGGLKPKDLMGIPWLLAFALRADGWYLRQDIVWNKPNPMPESVTDRCTKSHEYIFLFSKSAHYYYDNEAIKEPCIQDEMANGFRGGSYCNNETFKNEIGGKRKSKGNYRPPAGWDTEPGSHGTIHRDGRAVRYGGNKYTANPDEFYRTKSENAYEPREKLNKRSVWTVATQAYKEAHFATFPEELIKPCILAGSPEGGIVLDMFFGSGTTGKVALNNFRHYIGIELNPKYIELANKRLEVHKSQMDMFSFGVDRIIV